MKLFLSAFFFVVASVSLHADTALLGEPNSYPDVVFHSRFVTTSPDSFVKLDDNDYGYVSVFKDQGFANETELPMEVVPQHLIDRITSPQTQNHFRKVYPEIYTSESLKKLKQCPYLGIQTELDNDYTTTEWLASTSISLCLGLEERGIDDAPHMWLVQKTSNNSWRILMEADKSITISNPTQSKELGFKLLKTWIRNKYAWINKPDNCGGAQITWGNQSGHYQPKYIEYITTDCDFGKSDGDVRLEYEKKHKETVKSLVDERINALKPEVADQSSNQSTSTHINNPKASVSTSNPTSASRSKASVFTAEEKKAIQRLFKK